MSGVFLPPINPGKSFCQGQAFRQKFPLPRGLEDSFCFLEKESFLSLARGTGGPSINL